MNKINYQKELDVIIDGIKQKRDESGIFIHPKLLLHSCCAPCSSYCMEYLRDYFDITVFYYNPNISSSEEYQKRVLEEIRLIEEYNKQVDAYNAFASEKNNLPSELTFENGMKVGPNTRTIQIIEGDYIPQEFYDIAKGYELCPEGGDRCFRCFELRLSKSYEVACEIGAEYVTSTLTISPLKNAQKINEIGYALSVNLANEKVDDAPKWLPSDFKKKNGYKRSIELSQIFDLYRQNFCGCAFSK